MLQIGAGAVINDGLILLNPQPPTVAHALLVLEKSGHDAIGVHAADFAIASIQHKEGSIRKDP